MPRVLIASFSAEYTNPVPYTESLAGFVDTSLSIGHLGAPKVVGEGDFKEA